MKIIINVPDEFKDEVELGVKEYVEEFFGEGAVAEDGTVKKVTIEGLKLESDI